MPAVLSEKIEAWQCKGLLNEKIRSSVTANYSLFPKINGYVYEFSVDYNIADVDDIINIYKYLMKNHDIK